MHLILFIALLMIAVLRGQEADLLARETVPVSERKSLDKQIAAQFAPIFYQGLGDNPRADYITNFDFDGDWRGDNNWNNLENPAFALKAYVYYSVAETETHYFVHYAVFHPRDYKGDADEATASLLDILIGEGVRRAGKDPTGMADEVALSHENDLEGCLIVAEKKGHDLSKAEVRYVETLAHNRYLRYCARQDRPGLCEAIELNGQHPMIFIEPKGHGQLRYTGDRIQLKRSGRGMMTYTYAGRAEDADKAKGKSIGYDLIPIYDTLWLRAQNIGTIAANETYAESFDFHTRSILKAQMGQPALKIEQKFGSLGFVFRGQVGFKNKARPPWGWFDNSEKDRPQGEWFFDPAGVIARHLSLGQEFSTSYVYQPYFKIGS